MATILVTNDDGVRSAGLLALTQSLAAVGRVLVLAPERNWSASSHAKTMHKPLRVTAVALADGTPANSSSGSPTDCVALAAGGVLGAVPDLVVSGINSGYNLGVDITYSGTVACAMEATIKGIPGIAVSTDFYADHDLETENGLALAGRVAAILASEVLDRGLPAKTLLNVNVPSVAPDRTGELRITRMGNRHYPTDELIERHDPWGKPYYWLGGAGPVDDAGDGTDYATVQSGCVSVTPISLDMTDHQFVEELTKWSFAVPAP
jgi:5'-nucleotidase